MKQPSKRQSILSAMLLLFLIIVGDIIVAGISSRPPDVDTVTHRPITIQIEGSQIISNGADFGPVTNASFVTYVSITIVLNTNFNLYYIVGTSDHATANECVIRVVQFTGTSFSFSVTTTQAVSGAIDGTVPIYTAKATNGLKSIFTVRLYDMNAITACNYTGLLVADSF